MSSSLPRDISTSIAKIDAHRKPDDVPGIEDYLEDRGAMPPTSVAVLEEEFGEIRKSRPIVIKSAIDMANTILAAAWLYRPYLEKDCSVLVFGDLGTFKSFLALHWALTIAVLGHQVIYLSAEGKGMGQRIKGWAIDKFGDQWQQNLKDLPFFGVERPLNLSADDVIEALLKAIADGAIEPAVARQSG